MFIPAPEDMPEVYFPDTMKINNEYLSYFPSMSEYSASGDYFVYKMEYPIPVLYEDNGYSVSDANLAGMIICTWFFSNRESFQTAEGMLSEYILESGNVSTVEFDIKDEIDDVIKARELKNRLSPNDYWRPTYGPKVFNAARYESETTSGYFVVYSEPFVQISDDYFIVYYGTRGTTDLSNQTSSFEQLIAESYYFSEGSVGPLNCTVTSSEFHHRTTINAVSAACAALINISLLFLQGNSTNRTSSNTNATAYTAHCSQHGFFWFLLAVPLPHPRILPLRQCCRMQKSWTLLSPERM